MKCCVVVGGFAAHNNTTFLLSRIHVIYPLTKSGYIERMIAGR